MLKQLTISDFALAKALDIGFAQGLTVVTGESGAGKSVLLNALALALGGRASAELIRPGAQRAQLSAEFDIRGNAAAQQCLDAQALADPDRPERCLLRRVIGRDGRARAFVNGAPVNLALVRTLADGLMDIYGQGEHHRLANKEVQLALLDAYGVPGAQRQALAAAHRAWKRASQAAQELQARLAGIEERSELLGYQLAELQAANLAQGEFEALDAEFRRLSQAQSIRETILGAVHGFAELDGIRRAARSLDGIDDAHPALAEGRQALASALELADDALRDLRRYLEVLESDPQRLSYLEERLNLAQQLARKHRLQPQDLPRRADALETELQALDADRSGLAELNEQAARHRAQFQDIAAQVSRARHAAAERFAEEVSAAMNSLGIRGGRLGIQFAPADSEHGLESAEFLVTANPKYPPGSLGKIASGGERARIGLAIQTVAAARARLPCLALDEADVGVGGTAADVIGRMLHALARHTQVICVTHAPQVAALGDAHLLVEKDAQQEIRIRSLSDQGRVEELARMLAGTELTDKSRAYARTLLEEGAFAASMRPSSSQRQTST